MTPQVKKTVTFNKIAAFITRASVSFFEYGSLKSYGVLIQELTVDAQISFKAMGFILPLQRSLAYFSAPVASVVFNFLGARASVMLGGLQVGLGYVGLGCLPLHPMVLVLCCTCIGFGYGTAIVASFVHLKDTFGGGAKFGFIQTLTDQFCYIGIMILPIIFDKFQCLYGTQGAFLLFGGLNFNILVAGVSVRTSDIHSGIQEPQLNDVLHNKEHQLHNNDDHKEEGWSIRLFLRHYWLVLVRNPDIWFLCSASFLHYFNMIGWALFLVSLGEELGYSRSRAVLLSSCGGFGALSGRIWSLILFFHNVHNPFHFFGIPALMQCASFIGIVFTKNRFCLSAIMTFVSGISFGATGAATVGFCALKTSNRDFEPALAILFMVCAFGNEIGGGVFGVNMHILNRTPPSVGLLAFSELKFAKDASHIAGSGPFSVPYIICFVYDIYGSSKMVFFIMAIASFLASLISSWWTIFPCMLQRCERHEAIEFR